LCATALALPVLASMPVSGVTATDSTSSFIAPYVRPADAPLPTNALWSIRLVSPYIDPSTIHLNNKDMVLSGRGLWVDGTLTAPPAGIVPEAIGLNDKGDALWET